MILKILMTNLYHTDIHYQLNMNDRYDQHYKRCTQLYSLIRVYIIMIHLTRLDRVDKVIYEIIISSKFP